MGLFGVGPKEIIVVGLDLGAGRGKRCCGCHCSSVCQPGYLRSKKEVDGHDWILIVGNDAAKRRGFEGSRICPRCCFLIALLILPVLVTTATTSWFLACGVKSNCLMRQCSCVLPIRRVWSPYYFQTRTTRLNKIQVLRPTRKPARRINLVSWRMRVMKF